MRKLTLFILALIIFACKQPEARQPITVKTASFIDNSVERNKKLNAKEQASLEKLMKMQPENYIASENGFWYFYNHKVVSDSLQTPNFGDLITYNYAIKALNGTVIYSSEEIKTQTYVMDKQELFTGLREGLKLMRAGETITFLFPSQKAFGYYGDEKKIAKNTPIICEVTVNSIIQNQTN